MAKILESRWKGKSVNTSGRSFSTASGAGATHGAARAGLDDPNDGHRTVPSDLTLRVKALESLLVEKGLVDPTTLDALIDTYEHKVGPRNGARVGVWPIRRPYSHARRIGRKPTGALPMVSPSSLPPGVKHKISYR